MSRSYSKLISTPVPQSEPLNALQVPNNAGGFVHQLDDWKRLTRFLILGSDSNTYYQKAKDLTRENAACVTRCWDANRLLTMETITQISAHGRAPKNDAAIFALALGAAHSDLRTRQTALGALKVVCRTSTHLFQFIDNVRALGRGWGPTLRRAVASWYQHRNADQLAYQMIKYRSRERYTHKRLLQTAHPHPRINGSPEKSALFNWVLGKAYDKDHLPYLVQAHLDAMASNNVDEWTYLTKTYRLPWEALPTEAMRDPRVWLAMLSDMGLTAMIRNLGVMTENGAIQPLMHSVKTVVDRLLDVEELKKARIHPFVLLQALSVYQRGTGFRGRKIWQPEQRIVDALDEAFYLSFQAAQPTGKRILVALDVSGSMGSPIMDSALSCREAGAALALVTANVEPNHHLVGFSAGLPDAWVHKKTSRHHWAPTCRDGDGLSPLPFGRSTRLDAAVRAISNIPFGGTDCALPMIYAQSNGLKVDAFITITDNETWAGDIHPSQALKEYRSKSGIDAKLITIGMTSTGFSIADPSDVGSLDVVGFDSNVPALIEEFVRG
jgi:60 kDa SS-A/Ro ribonucleoprotein